MDCNYGICRRSHHCVGEQPEIYIPPPCHLFPRVTVKPSNRAVAIPFTEIARQELGKTMVANIVALGALAALTGAVTLTGLEAAVLNRVPIATKELNRKALEAGVIAARQYLAL